MYALRDDFEIGTVKTTPIYHESIGKVNRMAESKNADRALRTRRVLDFWAGALVAFALVLTGYGSFAIGLAALALVFGTSIGIAFRGRT